MERNKTHNHCRASLQEQQVNSVINRSLLQQLVGKVGVEPTESSNNRFTVCPATSYGLLSHKVGGTTSLVRVISHSPSSR